MTDQTVKLTTEGGDFSYPVLPGSVGPEVVDIRKLYAQTGKFTYDPGFTSTASCQSAITYIDGDQGILPTLFIVILGPAACSINDSFING